MELKLLINRYERVVRWRVTLKKLSSQGFDYGFRESIRLAENVSDNISREIIRELANNNVYREACKIIGVSNSVEPAILAVELLLHLSMTRLKGLLGFMPNRNEGRYDHGPRKHIAALATNLYLNAKRNMNVLNNITKVVDSLPKEQALYKIQLMILESLRVAYLLTTNATGR